MTEGSNRNIGALRIVLFEERGMPVRKQLILKKLLLIPMAIVLLTALMGCSLQRQVPLPIEMVAFNSLTEEEQDLIPVSPKDSTVEKIAVNDEIASVMDKTYTEDQVYSVTFHHTETDSTGKLTVFVSLDQETVVGKSFTR